MQPIELNQGIPSQDGNEDRSPKGLELEGYLREVAGHYRRERLTTALLPFLFSALLATLFGWILQYASGHSLLFWLAIGLAWGVGFGIFLAPHLRPIGLDAAAHLLDRRSAEADRFRSAWAFLQSSSRSGMEGLTIQRAEERTRRLELPPLFRQKVDRRTYPLALLSLLLLGHGIWFQRSLAEPSPGRLASPELKKQELLDELRQIIPEGEVELEALLERVEASQTLDQMLDLIEEMRERLGAAGIDEAVLATDLEKLTAELTSENQFSAAFRAEDLGALSQALREASQNPDSGAEGLREFLQDLPPSESMAQAQIRDLLEELQGARRALEQDNQAEASERLEAAAEELQQMADQRQSKPDKQAADRALEGLQRKAQQASDNTGASNPKSAEAGSMSSGGSVSAPTETPPDEASGGQVAGAGGDSSSPGLNLEPEAGAQRTPIEAHFEVEFGKARSFVREPFGKKTRDLPSVQVEAVRAPSDGRIRATQQLEEALSHPQLPRELREHIRKYFLAVNDGTSHNSGN